MLYDAKRGLSFLISLPKCVKSVFYKSPNSTFLVELEATGPNGPRFAFSTLSFTLRRSHYPCQEADREVATSLTTLVELEINSSVITETLDTDFFLGLFQVVLM